MDEPMAGIPPTMKVRERGASYDVPLSRRIYLSQLFGYLTIISIITFGIGSVAQVAQHKENIFVSNVTYTILKTIFVYVYAFLVSNMVVNTLLGVFYLSYRIHDIGSRKVGDK